MLEVPEGCIVCQESKATRGSKELFLKAVSVWINKPHVANRRLCGATVHHVRRCQTKPEAKQALIEANKYCGESMENTALWEAGQSFKELTEEKYLYTVFLRELVPKSEFFPRLYETIVYDKEKASVTFSPILVGSEENEAGKVLPTKELSYSIQFDEIESEMPVWAQVSEITMTWVCDQTLCETPRRQMTSDWLRSRLLSKLVSWSQVNDITTSATSLMLVAVDKYKDTYVRLKNTYGRNLVENWPERTDPKKFVYEDVAIAAYLLLIWEEDRQRRGLEKKQSFVDLGCGNGLLVYILTKEGHKGLGIDLRKRKIWDMFGPDVDLREEVVKPSSEHLFPDYDWLIGNHSDELTPWIPVIAARSSPTCSFFVLPCCHHDFVGKFCDTKKGQSRYGTYVDYVKEIVEHCGFHPEIDTLRIPSTKRISLIGRQRTYCPEQEDLADSRRQAFIDKRTLFSQQKKRIDSTASEEISTQLGKSSLSSGSDSSWRQRINSSTSEKPHGQIDCLDFDPSTYEPHGQLDSLDSGLGSLGSDYSSVPSTPEVMQKEYGINLRRSELPDTSRHTDDDQLVFDSSYTPSNLHVRKKMRTGSHSHGETKKPEGTPQSSEVKWAPGFQPRSEQGVRNCQAVPEGIKLHIVKAVFDLVLKSQGEGNEVQLPEGKRWRKGGSAGLSEVAALFDQLTLLELKAECGGLQTLLRNHSHIFQVSGGRVRLRDFSQADPWKGINPHKRQANKARAEQRDTRKTTLCWFYAHHPDGCPRSNPDCLFAHGQGELRKKLH